MLNTTSHKLILLLACMAFLMESTTASAAGFWAELASPLTTDAGYFFYPGAVVSIVVSSDGMQDNLGADVQNETVEDEPLGTTSKIGDLAGQMIPNAAYALGAYTIGWLADSRIAVQRGTHMVKSTFYSSLVTTVLKYSVREKRPNSNNRDAFPSGHTTTAFAFAATVATEHAWYWGIMAYTLASFTGFSRINDNAHRLHDVVAGAVIGTSYGLSIYYMRTRQSFFVDTMVVPLDDDGLLVSFRKTF